MSKLGLVHRVVIDGSQQDILVVPTSDVYLLSYSASYNETAVIREKPVIVIGTYRHLDNILSVEGMFPYNAADVTPSVAPVTVQRSMWDSLLRFIQQFK